MAKPAGALCNLDCEYCYFLSKEQLYPGRRTHMSEDVHEAWIRQLLQGHGNGEVVVAFQGGEPTLMGLDFFRRTIELERRFARPGQQVLNALQTNGTFLDDAWGEFLAEHDFLVGISIDGPRQMHDTFRVDKGGKPTFERVMRGLDVLRRHGVEWNALTTVHAANAEHGRTVYTFLRDDCGATFTQFIPIVERTPPELLPLAEAGRGIPAKKRPLYRQSGNQVTSRSVRPEQYGQFLVDIFEEWIRRDVGTIYVQQFDTALAHWLGMDQAGVCVHAKTCGAQVALEHNGDVYSCDHYVEAGYLLGNITTGPTLAELITSPRQRRFGDAKEATLPQYCRSCDVRFACHGGCPKDRFIPAPTGEPGLTYLCAGYRRFFHHIDPPMRSMADLLRTGRPAADIMKLVARNDARRSRNSPCTCGGARKWKHCHGIPAARAAARTAMGYG
ncbi:anaerobic sulfatase maturase [Nonomuraea basaltis]|uniref:anaerobic sulfatase maturase n=1 Tax=Nonomuraea basaltis TaxID=2495887 RepID=UPI001F101765|nr:anaerobic sulfatase maturase [Nonomuraea basaltis]